MPLTSTRPVKGVEINGEFCCKMVRTKIVVAINGIIAMSSSIAMSETRVAITAVRAQSRTVEYQAGDIGRLGQTALHNLRGER